EIAISLNESILDIFGVPSGVVMDTNFYTQHSAMETGLTITTPRIQTEWETANFTNAAKKCALQWRNTYDQTTDNFVETRFYQDIVIPSCRGLSGAHQDGVIQLFEHAWNSTLFREVEIQLKIVELAAERSSPSVAGSIFKGTIRQVRSPLTDRHNLKMTATQALYKEKIIESEKKYQAYIVQKDRLNAELDRISAGDAELRAVLTEQLEGPVDWPIDRPVSEEARATLRALKTQMDIAAFESITAQSDADQFAHESYFSQASILAVVGLMQMGGTGPMKIGEPGGPGIRARFPMIDQPRTMQAAALENLGDWIKELGHHGDSPPRFALNGAKYLFRLSNCAGQFLAMGGKTASLSGVAGKQALSKCNIIFDTAKAILSIKKDTKRSPEEKESQALKLFRNLHERIWPGSDSLDDKAIAQDIVSQVTDLITQLAAPPIQDPI
ncbi:hypothetical protein EBR96_08635, partial [bacterium]|nr:hypothetical protein [bacterium]